METVESGTVKRYAVVCEGDQNGWNAYVPDLPICFAAARTRGEVERLIREAIEFHLEGLLEDGGPIPQPTTTLEPGPNVGYVDVAISLHARGLWQPSPTPG